MPLFFRIARPSGKTGPSSTDDQIRELAVNADCPVLPGLAGLAGPVLRWRPNLAETSQRQQILSDVQGTAADLFSEPIAIGRCLSITDTSVVVAMFAEGRLRVPW
jgi:hypothetical protein